MATYEERVRETDRFTAIDTGGGHWTVIEMTTYKLRIGFVTKIHTPLEVGRTYSLLDGPLLLQRGPGEYQTQDGRLRLTRDA